MQDSLSLKVNKKLDGEQLFKISRFKEVIKRTRPHKHDSYFEVIYLSEGAGFHWIDTQKFQITPPVVYFLSGQLHYWEMTSVPKGYVLLFREEFFNHLKQSGLLNLIHSMENTVNINLSPDERLDFIFDDMEREYKNPSANSVELIQGYLQVVLVKLLRHKAQQDSTLRISPTDQVFKKFLNLVQNANPVANLKVNHVAEMLNVSPQNLNAITRKAAGKAASELIGEQVTLEAKRYLLHTDKTVSEIAFALNFSDPSHFVKYFKKSTGETPQTFRSKHLQ
jgi:AraC family transcriptional regulator, transcriptional activator of pobA